MQARILVGDIKKAELDRLIVDPFNLIFLFCIYRVYIASE